MISTPRARPRSPDQGRALAAADLPVLLLTPLWLWWAVDDGGYSATDWIPGLVYVTGLAVVLALAGDRPARPGGALLVALGAVCALAGWSVVSVLWAGDQGLAWRESTRTVLFAASFAVPVLWPPTTRAVVAALALAAVASTAALVAGVVAAFDGGAALADGRLTDPAGYANAVAAIVLVGAAAIVPLALDARRRPWTRGLALGVATVLVSGALLAQSRGALAATIVVAIVLVAAVPRRGAAVVALGAIAAATLLTSGVVLDVLPAAEAGNADAALRDAVLALAAAGVLSTLAGALLARADRRAPPVPLRLPGSSRAYRRGAAALAATVLVGALALAVGTGWVGDRLDSLSTPDYDRLEQQDSRFSGDLGSNRVDYWEASLETLRASPLLGEGAGGFAEAYVLRRETDLTPLYAHSVWMQEAADLGAIGLLLLATFAAALGSAIATSWRRAAPPERFVVAGAALPLVYVGVHGSVDWVTAFPAVMVPALALAAAAATVRDGVADRPRLPRRVLAAGLAPLVLVTLAALPLYFSWRYLERAAGAHPAAALADLRRAADANPLSPAPSLNAGLVLVGQGRDDEARAAFAEAVDRNPGAWFPLLMHGVLEARRDRPAALRELDEAVRLNPRDSAVRRIRRSLRAGHDPAASSVARTFVEQRD